MPLCPQITNTPITVTQTADFTVTSIVPLIADSFDGLANNFESIEILADGKTKVYRANDEPTGAEINNGDLWIDLNDGNKLYVRAGGVWTSAQDGSIATAQSTANSASSAAAAAAAEAAAANAAAVAAQSTANSAATAAGAAQSTANTALANAATAFTTAQNSLQPSAYAIQNPTTKQLTSIDATGLTVYSGASATSGARVVLNSAGLAGFNSGGTATFSISASTGAAVFSGSVTGSTITGGTLNIGGNAIIDATGLLTATGATITGTINAKAGYFGTPTNGFSISSTGLVGVGTGTIVGGTIQGATFTNGSTFSVTSAGVLTATSGTIGGVTLSASAITGGTIQTSSSGDAVVMSGSSNSLFFKYAGTVYGHMMANTSGNVMIHYGATATPAGTAYPQLFVGSSAVSIAQSVTRFVTIDSNGLGVNGDLSVASGAFYTGTYETTSTAQTVGAYIPQSGAVIARRDNQIPIFAHRFNASGTAELIRLVYNGSDAGGIQTSSAGSPSFRSTSDYRLKNNIQDYTAGTNIIKNLRVRSYEMNNNPGKTEIGFIAHEYAETVPDMVNGAKDAIDADGNPEYQSISTTNLIPYIVGALKDAILRIESLEQGE